jgi:branched-subunit amino acid ABC-type transport system permease component
VRYRDGEGGSLDLDCQRHACGSRGRFPRADRAIAAGDGFNLLLAIFTAAILGGTGSLFGAVIGGLAVGLAENLSLLIIPSGYKAAVPFVLLMLVLYFRPRGLFGSADNAAT